MPHETAVSSHGLSEPATSELTKFAQTTAELKVAASSMTDATSTHKKLFVRTYGCQMNVYDSERMTDVLVPLGYRMTASPHNADMIIINTCHIREKATEKLFSELGRIKAHKQRRARQGQATIIAVTGCVAQAEGAEIIKRAPYVDCVLGPQNYHELPAILRTITAQTSAQPAPVAPETPSEMAVTAQIAASAMPRAQSAHGTPAFTAPHSQPSMRTAAPIIHTEFPVESKFDHLPANANNPALSKFVAVQEGCDKFCTFCVVPYTRGAEFSRPIQPIIEEVQTLVDAGTREVTLLGQNVNAYHGIGPDGRTWALADLLYALSKIPGLLRLRYTTSHPNDMTRDLIMAHRDLPVLMPYLHLPLQSGSDAVLQRMNRQYTLETYCEWIAELRKARPDVALSSDFIVGFPGETDADFQATIDAVMAIGFAQSYSFKYSLRPGTPAGDASDQISETVKDARLQTLQKLLFAQQTHFNQACVGRTLPVLIEHPGRHPGQWIGRSPYLQSVHLSAPDNVLGKCVQARIIGGHLNSLSGILAMPGSEITG